MPPDGARPGVQRGNEGEDWKWRKVFGRVMDGVGGTATLVIPLLVLSDVVLIVRPTLANFLLGGVGGLTKEGEDGADVRSGAFAKGGANGADMMARPRL
jgi:hypothetical protein